jgi:RNA polymerase sigma-70 factor (ECF subfamily)
MTLLAAGGRADLPLSLAGPLGIFYGYGTIGTCCIVLGSQRARVKRSRGKGEGVTMSTSVREDPAEKPPPPVDVSEWVDKYGDYLYRYAMLRLQSQHAAEDAVQETFLAGIKNIEKFDGRVDVKYWLRGILRNKVVDYIRKASRERPVEDSEVKDMQDRFVFKAFGVATTRPAPWQFDPHRAYEKTEFWEVLHRCIAKLKGPTQQAFTLKMLEGLSTDEVCEAMKITPNYLWVMLHRARAQLKTCLEANWAAKED